MSTILVFEQMMVILLLMLVGAITQKIKQIDQSQQQLLSWLVVNVFNPALSISSVLSSDTWKSDLYCLYLWNRDPDVWQFYSAWKTIYPIYSRYP